MLHGGHCLVKQFEVKSLQLNMNTNTGKNGLFKFGPMFTGTIFPGSIKNTLNKALVLFSDHFLNQC